MNRLVVLAAMLGVAIAWPGTAAAQVLGTFRWQQLPYCNVITVRVVQAGATFQLDGVDDQCGAATQASVVGLAFQNPNGTIGLGFTIVTTPGGTPLHLDATVSLPGASGTWRDSAGNTGAFALTPGAAAPGNPRPTPKASFPGGVTVGGGTISNVGAPVAAGDAANKGYVDAATASVRAAMLGEKVWKAHFTSTGSKNATGPYTSTRTGVGQYLVTIDVAGLDLPVSPPIAVASPFSCAGFTAGTSSALITTGIGGSGTVTGLQISVRTFDAAGAAADCGAYVLVSMPDANSGSPVPPLDQRATVHCEGEGERQVCTITPR